MAKKRQIVEIPVERYENTEDIPVVTKDRDLTPEEISEMYEKAAANKEAFEAANEPPGERPPAKKGILKCKCACGRVANISEEVVEDGLSWSMIIGNDHFLTLHCEECGSNLTMFIDEILGDELPEEGNKE
jgi:hypothetical protein